MREDLIGYLLGALEPEEMQRISDLLREDPELRAELKQLERALRPLDEANDIYEPPGDLVERTMAAIPFGEAGAGDGGEEPAAAPELPSAVGLSPDNRPAPRDWRWTDVVATSAAALVLAGLIMPGILRERAGARQVACQSQLREMGTALTGYAVGRPDQRLPHLTLQGPEAVSGIYSLRLAGSGLLDSDRPLWCPSLSIPDQWEGEKLPTLEQLRNASGAQLVFYQRGIGGHYAYSLGVLEGGSYRAPRFQGRSRFAIMADAPMQALGGWVMGHEGRGCNILYEDGHVEFVSDLNEGVIGDHPFLNRSGDLERGLDPDDAALGPSDYPPITFIGGR